MIYVLIRMNISIYQRNDAEHWFNDRFRRFTKFALPTIPDHVQTLLIIDQDTPGSHINAMKELNVELIKAPVIPQSLVYTGAIEAMLPYMVEPVKDYINKKSPGQINITVRMDNDDYFFPDYFGGIEALTEGLYSYKQTVIFFEETGKIHTTKVPYFPFMVSKDSIVWEKKKYELSFLNGCGGVHVVHGNNTESLTEELFTQQKDRPLIENKIVTYCKKCKHYKKCNTCLYLTRKVDLIKWVKDGNECPLEKF